MALDADGNMTTALKLEEECTTTEDELTLGNSKALNALFNGVDKNMFRLIKQCTVAKDAWEILKTAHEGISKDFYMNVLDIANSFDSLGEKLTDEKLVRKILRSLPERFDMKVTTIEEAQDISSMKVDELIGSLQNFELVVDNRSENKGKGVAFVSKTKNNEPQGDLMGDEDLSENPIMLGRQFNRILKHVNTRARPNGQNIRFNTDLQTNSMHNVKSEEKSNQYKGVQCHECEGYGHIRTECAAFLRKQKKSLTVSWSDDDESEGDERKESVKHVAVL